MSCNAKGYVSDGFELVTDAPFDAYVILDFEATCVEGQRIKDPEVIEFPFVVVDAKEGKCVTEFQRYVRPVCNPHLTDFCVKLTGITQCAVDQADDFSHVWLQVLSFLHECHLEEAVGKEHKVEDPEKHAKFLDCSACQRRRYCIVCCGDWDVRHILPRQIAQSRRLVEETIAKMEQRDKDLDVSSMGCSSDSENRVPADNRSDSYPQDSLNDLLLLRRVLNTVPPSWRCWCNIKHFVTSARTRAVLSTQLQKLVPFHITGMTELLDLFNLPLIGREHSGIDDCRNIASLVCELVKCQCPPQITASTLSWCILPEPNSFSFFSFDFTSHDQRSTENAVANLKRDCGLFIPSSGVDSPSSSSIPFFEKPHYNPQLKPLSWPPPNLDPFAIRQKLQRVSMEDMKMASNLTCESEPYCGGSEERIAEHSRIKEKVFFPSENTLSHNFSTSLSSVNVEGRKAASSCFSPTFPLTFHVPCHNFHGKGMASFKDTVNWNSSSLLSSSFDLCTEEEVISPVLEMYKSLFLKESTGIQKKIACHRSHSTQLSKFLSYILRHAAQKKGIPMTSNGFVRLDHLAMAPEFPLRKQSFANAVLTIANVVKNCPKNRFILGVEKREGHSIKTGSGGNRSGGEEQGMNRKNEDDVSPPFLYIAATQGHSISGVNVFLKRLTRVEEAPVAIHGTTFSAWIKILEDGFLSSMSRQHIHFAKGLPSENAVTSGMRASCTVLIYLNVPKVLEPDSNVVLLESTNGVLLTSGESETGKLPLSFVLKVVDREGNILFSTN